MPTKRRPLKRLAATRITEAAIEAYKAGNYRQLHTALGLFPWEMSPLPRDVTPLGCDPDEPEDDHDVMLWRRSWKQAVELQRALEDALAGTALRLRAASRVRR